MSRKLRKNTMVATMLLLIGAAVFLNWKYTADSAEKQVDGKILGEATLVSGEGDSAGADEETVYTGSDYFASARLTRQQARDNAIDLLEKAAGENGADTSVLNEASESIQVLASYALTESQIENLVTAKGYRDCVAFMSDDSVSVVVATDGGELTAEDVAKITDITKNETGYAADSIKIMAAD